VRTVKRDQRRIYSMATVPVLCCDLARAADGGLLAEILGVALRCEGDDINDLARFHREDSARWKAWLELATLEVRYPRMGARRRTSPPLIADRRSNSEPKRRSWTGTLDDLLWCVRDDVLARPVTVSPKRATAATAVVCDAVAACYGGSAISAGSRARLLAPWLSARRGSVPPDRADDAYGPQTAAVRPVLDRISQITPGEVARLQATGKAGWIHATEWHDALHAAAWTAYLTERTRPTAAAQLRVIDQLWRLRSDVRVTDRDGWSVISGGVQALCLADVLDDVTVRRLLMPLADVLDLPN
jgi:hypothetical protein